MRQSFPIGQNMVPANGRKDMSDDMDHIMDHLIAATAQSVLGRSVTRPVRSV